MKTPVSFQPIQLPDICFESALFVQNGTFSIGNRFDFWIEVLVKESSGIWPHLLFEANSIFSWRLCGTINVHQCPIHWPWSSLTWLRQYVSRGESKYPGPATVVGVTSGAAQPLKASLVSIKGNHLCEIPSWSWLTCHRNWFVWGQSQTHFAKLTITCVTGCVLFFFEQFDHFYLVSLSTM